VSCPARERSSGRVLHDELVLAVHMCGPFCSVPAVPMMTVVVPPLMRSRHSAHVSYLQENRVGGLPRRSRRPVPGR